MKVHHNHTAKHLTLGIASTLSLATILGVGIYSATNIVNNTNNANALSYSTNEDISFTFKPTLSISLSTGALTIDNLVPGTTSDSNAVTVTVSSNTPYGYVLSAGVGSTVSTDPYYNTSDLVHDNTATQVPTTNKFSSIATSASLQTLDTDNTWGYSTSTDGGTSWSTYSGLSHAETKPLLDISDPATPSTIDFKIAARSASTQASGTYNNVITFYAVGKPEPVYMQEPEVIKAKLKNVGDELQAIDQRDGKEYWVARLADDNIWMTQNLDLDLKTNKILTPADTDISASWWPDYNTREFTGTPLSGWYDHQYYPNSADPGEVYYYDYGKYTSLAACQAAHPDCSAHNHVGNYYNWSAAVAQNTAGMSIANYYKAPGSICPAGWKLPKITGASYTTTDSEFGSMLVAEGIATAPIKNVSYVGNGFNNIGVSPLWLNRSGYFSYGNSRDGGSVGRYWSGTVSDANYAYEFYFSSSYIRPSSTAHRGYGQSVRCLVK